MPRASEYSHQKGISYAASTGRNPAKNGPQRSCKELPDPYAPLVNSLPAQPAGK
ncbi:MAG: hypothetical protein R2727_10175 [Bacteroidales bacterium]